MARRRTIVDAIAMEMDGMVAVADNEAMSMMPSDQAPELDMSLGRNEENCGFTEEDYAIAKEFVEQIGGAERARELIDKLDDCYECLDLVPAEQEQIDDIAAHMPDEVDFPTSRQVTISSMFDPGH